MSQSNPINAYRRPTAAPGDFCYISQADWDHLRTTAQSGDVKLAKKAKNKLQKLDVAGRYMGNEGCPAQRACDYCTYRRIPCRVRVNHTIGQMCALCRWGNISGCNANAVVGDEEEIDEEGADIDDDNEEDAVEEEHSHGMAVDEDDEAEFSDIEMDYISTSGTRGEASPEKEEYVDTEKRYKDGNFNREFGAILAASLERVDDLAKESVTRVVALEGEVERLKGEVVRLRHENMQILNDNQNMRADLNKLMERVNSGA